MAGLEEIQHPHREQATHPAAPAVRPSHRFRVRPLPSPAYRRFPASPSATGPAASSSAGGPASSSAAPAGAAAAAPAEAPASAIDLCGNPSTDEVRLPSRPESAATARRLAESVVVGHWGMSPRVAEHAVLLVSELVGNAVRHTGARTFALRMSRRRNWIRIEVRDPSRALPCLMPVREMDTSGRGLFLVDKLADRWGVDLLPRGKSTWVEMRVPDRG